jgi:hypothetical protein
MDITRQLLYVKLLLFVAKKNKKFREDIHNNEILVTKSITKLQKLSNLYYDMCLVSDTYPDKIKLDIEYVKKVEKKYNNFTNKLVGEFKSLKLMHKSMSSSISNINNAIDYIDILIDEMVKNFRHDFPVFIEIKENLEHIKKKRYEKYGTKDRKYIVLGDTVDILKSVPQKIIDKSLKQKIYTAMENLNYKINKIPKKILQPVGKEAEIQRLNIADAINKLIQQIQNDLLTETNPKTTSVKKDVIQKLDYLDALNVKYPIPTSIPTSIPTPIPKISSVTQTQCKYIHKWINEHAKDKKKIDITEFNQLKLYKPEDGELYKKDIISCLKSLNVKYQRPLPQTPTSIPTPIPTSISTSIPADGVFLYKITRKYQQKGSTDITDYIYNLLLIRNLENNQKQLLTKIKNNLDNKRPSYMCILIQCSNKNNNEEIENIVDLKDIKEVYNIYTASNTDFKLFTLIIKRFIVSVYINNDIIIGNKPTSTLIDDKDMSINVIATDNIFETTRSQSRSFSLHNLIKETQYEKNLYGQNIRYESPYGVRDIIIFANTANDKIISNKFFYKGDEFYNIFKINNNFKNSGVYFHGNSTLESININDETDRRCSALNQTDINGCSYSEKYGIVNAHSDWNPGCPEFATRIRDKCNDRYALNETKKSILTLAVCNKMTDKETCLDIYVNNIPQLHTIIHNDFRMGVFGELNNLHVTEELGSLIKNHQYDIIFLGKNVDKNLLSFVENQIRSRFSIINFDEYACLCNTDINVTLNETDDELYYEITKGSKSARIILSNIEQNEINGEDILRGLDELNKLPEIYVVIFYVQFNEDDGSDINMKNVNDDFNFNVTYKEKKTGKLKIINRDDCRKRVNINIIDRTPYLSYITKGLALSGVEF